MLDEDGRIGGAKAIAQAFGVGAIAEGADLNGEKARGGIHVAKNFQANGHDARADGFNFARGGQRKIDDAIFDEGAAVGDANRSGLTVVEIGDADHGFERKGAMGGGKFVHIVDFAIGSVAAVERVAVPGGVALFGIAGRGWRWRSLGAF